MRCRMVLQWLVILGLNNGNDSSSQSDSPGANDSNPIRQRNLCEGINNADHIILLLEKDLDSSQGVTRLLTEYVRVSIPLQGFIGCQTFSTELITTINHWYCHHISFAY